MDLLAEYPKIADDASDIVTSCCQLANLKPHTVQLQRGKRLSVAYSINLKILQHPHSQRLFLKNTSSLLPLDNPMDLSFEKLNLDSLCSQDVLGVSNESMSVDKARRFRPEFVMAYHQALSADALTSHSSATTKERDVNDIEALKASKYLRENWIPAFVKRLDSMELRPLDSHSLSKEMHRAGVNIRNLGMHCLL